MIGALSGKLSGVHGDDIVVDVQGVGYLVTPTASVFEALGPPGSGISLHIFTDVKENDISLYGFNGRLEREVFLLLRKVKGIGSKAALGIVSSMGPEQVLGCIGSEDIGGLQRVPGVGKKTAERVIVELRERVSELTAGVEVPLRPKGKAPQVSTIAAGGSSASQDAVLALEKLGVSADKAARAVESAAAELGGGADSGELLKTALVNL